MSPFKPIHYAKNLVFGQPAPGGLRLQPATEMDDLAGTKGLAGTGSGSMTRTRRLFRVENEPDRAALTNSNAALVHPAHRTLCPQHISIYDNTLCQGSRINALSSASRSNPIT